MAIKRDPLDARKKKCRVCKESFAPFTSLQVVCGVPCSIAWAQVVQRRGKSQVPKVARAKLRADRERIKPKSKWMSEAQSAFNAYIRLRDDGQPCISCGVVDLPEKYGGSWDCGHYLTRGAHPELRFEELNAHRQCKRCNGGSGRFSAKGHTVQQEYRIRLIEKIGLDKVEWLEGPHKPKRYRVSDLKAIKAEYLKKRRELAKEMAND